MPRGGGRVYAPVIATCRVPGDRPFSSRNLNSWAARVASSSAGGARANTCKALLHVGVRVQIKSETPTMIPQMVIMHKKT
jgi:hypothetical protein